MNLFKKLFQPKTQEGLNADLWTAVDNNDLRALKKAVSEGADINLRRGENEETALMCFIKKSDEPSVLRLIDLGADVSLKDKHGNSLLILSADVNVDLIAKLLSLGLDVNAKNNEGETALMVSTKSGFSATTEKLIKTGADLNAQDNEGKTALMFAVISYRTESIHQLVEAGADVHAKDKNGRTALDILNENASIWPPMGASEKFLRETMENIQNHSLTLDEKDTIIQKVSGLSDKDILKLPEQNPKLLNTLVIMNGLLESAFEKLSIEQQKALYSKTYKDVSPDVKAAMERKILESYTRK